MKGLWVVSYDISDNRIRHRVCQALKDHGERVQYSVFECWLDRGQLQGLRKRIGQMIQGGDQVRWYPICDWCRKRTFWDGPGDMPEDRGFEIV